MVISRAQARREQLEDKELQRKQLQSEVQPHILEDEEDSSEVSHTQSDEEETSQSIQPVHEHLPEKMSMDINEESTLTSKSLYRVREVKTHRESSAVKVTLVICILKNFSSKGSSSMKDCCSSEKLSFTPKLSIIHD